MKVSSHIFAETIKNSKQMSNFRIGQEVVCIDAKGSETLYGTIKSGLVEGNVYPVLAIIKERCCGIITLDVGIIAPNDTDESICVCGHSRPHYGIWYFRASRFAPLQTDAEEADMNEALQEVFERELFQA